MFMTLLRNGGFGFGGDGAGTATQGIETQAQLNAIRTQLQDNQNADCIKSAIQSNGFALSQLVQTLNIDFNTLQKCCCDIQAAIQQVAGQVGFSAEHVIAAIERGNSGLLAAVKDCCCQTQKELIQMAGDIKLQNCQMTGELRNGQRDLGFAITQGFSATAFQAQQDKCDILRAGQDNTQRIIDTLNNHWKDEQALKIQDLKFELSQERQNNLINERFNRLGNCGCQATTQVIVEEFMTAFQEQTGLPTNVVLSAEGQTQRLANVSCGSSNCLAIYSSLTVTITPAAAPAA